MSLRNTLLSAVLLVSGTLGVIGLRPAMPVSAADGTQAGGLPYLLPSHFPPRSSTSQTWSRRSTVGSTTCGPSTSAPA
jgi:hypothetical protein